MRLIFPWAYSHPWRLLWFYVAVFICFLFSSGGDIQYAILPALIVAGAMIGAAVVATNGMTKAAAIQTAGLDRQAQLMAQAAKDAANTPLAKAQEKFGLEAYERLKHDKYVGLNAGQKRKMMRQALYGYDAAMRASEIDLRRRIGAMGFGRSGMVMEALSDMNEGKKDVAAKTASAGEALSAEIADREKSRDVSIATGTPDVKAAALREIAGIRGETAMAQANVAASAVQAKSGVAASALYGGLTYQPPEGYQPWWTQGWYEGKEEGGQSPYETYGAGREVY